VMLRSKQTCADCHFFVKEARGLPTPEPIVLNVSAGERRSAKGGDFSWTKETQALACHFGVWDEGFNFDQRTRTETIAGVNRRGFCFFWHYRPGMMIPAAKVLQEREAQARLASRDRRLTILGLWVAVIALGVNVYLTVADRWKIWPFNP